MVMEIPGGMVPVPLSKAIADDPVTFAQLVIRQPLTQSSYNHAGALMNEIVAWLYSVGGQNASEECLKALEALRLYRVNYEAMRAVHKDAYNSMTTAQRDEYEAGYGAPR